MPPNPLGAQTTPYHMPVEDFIGQELVAALEKYMAQHNREPKPFIWTAKANDILAKVARARKKLPRKRA
jgi:hypothetical protein